MRYAFLNNFSQILAADLAAGATTLTLDGGGSLLSNASADLVYTLTLDDGEGTTEIVHVTGATGNDLTIERGKEGTTDAAWPTGTTVEMRVTAESVTSLQEVDSEKEKVVIVATSTSPETIALGSGSTITETNEWDSYGSILLGSYSSIDDAYESVLLGSYAFIRAGSNAAVAVGAFADVKGDSNTQGMAIGAYATSSSPVGGFGFTCAVGTGSSAEGSQSYSTGPYAVTKSDYSMAAGSNAKVLLSSDRASSFGADAEVKDNAPSAMASGDSATVSAGAARAIAHGYQATAGAPESVSLGSRASSGITGGLVISALSYVPSSYPSATGMSATAATRQSANQVVVATDPLDLTDGTSAVTLDLPTDTMFFIAAIDVVIVGSDTPGGTPEISVGPDDVTPAAYLAATPVGKSAVGGRETHSPLVSDGVTSLRVATTTAGSGTTYQAKIVIRGYVMEL